MKLNITSYDKVCGKRSFPWVMAALSLVIVLMYSRTTSPLFGIEAADSAMFKTMGRVLTDGGVPYVDYFDHKGPYLYLINAVGEWLSPVWGLFAMQVVWNALTLSLWFMTARLFARPSYAFAITLSAIIGYIGVYCGGNLSEEWSLLPASLTCFLALSYLLESHDTPLPHPVWQSLVYGLCFGFMFLVRPNDAVMVCGGAMTGIFLFLVFRRRAYANAALNALAFAVGATIAAAPWIIYFAQRDALADFWFGLIGFNMGYGGGVFANLLNIWPMLQIIILASIAIALTFEAKRRGTRWLIVPVAILTLMLYGRNGYLHYYITLIPCLLLPALALLFCQPNRKVTFCFVIPLLVSDYCIEGVAQALKIPYQVVTGTFARDLQEIKEYEDVRELFAVIPEAERDSVWNCGDRFSALFLQCGIRAQNPVPPVIAEQSEFMMQVYVAERRASLGKETARLPRALVRTRISEVRPKWLFTEPVMKFTNAEDSVFVARNYEYARQSRKFHYMLLKRKE